MKKLFHYSIAIAALLLGATELQAAPVNDNFANATVLTTYYDQREGTTVGATKEALEATTDVETVWYKVTTPNHPCSLNVSLKVYSVSYYSHRTRIYQSTGSGGLSQLVEVGMFATGGGEVDGGSLAVSGATTYYIRVGPQFTGTSSPIQLTVDITPKDSWSGNHQAASAYYSYFASYGDTYSAAAYYSYFKGMGDYNYYAAFGQSAEALYAYYQGMALYNYYILLGRGDSRGAGYNYNLNYAYAYYYYYYYKGQTSNAASYYNYFVNQANGAYL